MVLTTMTEKSQRTYANDLAMQGLVYPDIIDVCDKEQQPLREDWKILMEIVTSISRFVQSCGSEEDHRKIGI